VASGVCSSMTIQRVTKRFLLIVALSCAYLLAQAGGVIPSESADSSETTVYKAFVKQHTAWAGGCENAVLDSSVLSIAEGFQPSAFSRERVKPPKDLIAQLSQPALDLRALQATGESFFKVVDHATLQQMFSEGMCTIRRYEGA
jgi:hypothetical protein